MNRNGSWAGSVTGDCGEEDPLGEDLVGSGQIDPRHLGRIVNREEVNPVCKCVREKRTLLTESIIFPTS